ncbi:MAG: hypothetical protein F6K34_17105 [Okeania sp. SIO4D6]|nr:hypothetical protein [Okeania sp. SIO4D6]
MRGHREVEAAVLRQKQKSLSTKKSSASKREISGCLPTSLWLPTFNYGNCHQSNNH